MSAQDTVLGHSFSNADLISSITSNPRAEFWFGTDIFSVIMFWLLSSRIDASQPCKIVIVYLHETVMEMQPEQRSRHSGFSCNGLCNNGLDNLFCSGAGVVIELWVEIPTRSFATET